MSRFALTFAALIALPLANASATPRTSHTHSVARDWTSTVVVTKEGGFRMGNPAARVKLVEYGSLACPHCRHFEETGYKPLLQKYVRTGAVSYEFRNFLLNGPDLAVTLLTRCAGSAKFFPMAALVYERQPQWEAKIQQGLAALGETQKTALDKMADQERIVRLADLGGLQQLGGAFGVTPARARQCLSDPKALQQVLGLTQAAAKAGIEHTPTFLLNGKVNDASTWEQLEPLIRRAGAHG